MSNRYGQTITWSTPTAPHPFSGVCTRYSYRDARTRQLDDDEAGDFRALIQHSQKAALEFEAKITEDSTDFLDLSAGAKITVSGIASGTVLCSRAVERWALGQSKTASITATHYPDITGGAGASAGVALDAFTPDQSALGIVTPSGVLKYGTYGLGHAVGIVHGLTITQELQIAEDDPSPAGTILGATSHGYLRTIELLLLATGAIPATGSTLALTGAPDHAADYKIENAELRFQHKGGKMYQINAVWIPPFTA